jgi:hypothetical protein
MDYGVEQLTDEDRGYCGSRFADVKRAIFANPYRTSPTPDGVTPLPVYRVTFRSVIAGALGICGPYIFRQATARTVDSSADLRWGPDRRGFRRLLHPNGVCLTGRWTILEDSGYSGYFRKGSEALVVARYSTCCAETRRGHTRSLAMVGKLFPTTNPDHVEPLHTANFITQQDIGGDSTDFINDAQLLNAPNTTAARRSLGAPILLVTGAVFALVDREPSIRQLYQIAELAKPKAEATRTPRFMRLTVAANQPRIPGKNLDFREEVLAQIFDPGNPTPMRKLTFDIEVTDDGQTKGIPGWQARSFQNWRRIGSLEFDNAVVSYNGDFVVHFNHPTWRRDPNDGSTATRMSETKVYSPEA